MNLSKRHGRIPSILKPSLNLRPTTTTLKTPTPTTLSLEILTTQLSKCRSFKQFTQILSQMILSSFLSDDTFAASKLLSFSTSSSFVPFPFSLKIFHSLKAPNPFIYNTLMKAYRREGDIHTCIDVYRLMLEKGEMPDNFTFPILLHALCSDNKLLESLELGRELHCRIVKMGFHCDVYVLNNLINMYVVNGELVSARKVFDDGESICVLDCVSWNSMLAGYIKLGDVEEAKRVYELMPVRNVIASNSMIVLFGKKGCVEEACRLFGRMSDRDMVTWSALVACYEGNAMSDEALVLFKEMLCERILVDEVVVVSVLSACVNLASFEMGKLVHGLSVRIGIENYVSLVNALIRLYSTCGEIRCAQGLFDAGYYLDLISWNSMISGYVRCGSIESARSLFDSMPEKDIVSWSAMISGYAHQDRFSEALSLFQDMQVEGVCPDETILVSAVSACTQVAAFDQGKWIHAYIRKNGLLVNPILGTTLIDMYMKCGCVDNALEVFKGMEERGVSSWNAVIVGLAMNGLVERSLDTFHEMKKCGVVPNEITFIGVLGACRHMGIVHEGRGHFDSMINDFNLEPNVKHYGCIVDLLGRAGMLKEAEEVILNMPVAPDVATWGALLGACKKYGNNEIGERVGRKLIELHPEHDGFHVLLSNIFASRGSWDNVLQIRRTMNQGGVVKEPGCSLIEANGGVHEFLAGDVTHPQMAEIENMLDEMARKLKSEGYAPDMNQVSHDIDDEEKETSLSRHSEKLAIAFGLISIPPPIPIRIMKNLRICNDCHMAAKLISKAFNREIVVRDRHRFHRFKQGSCSCMDYW